MARRRRKSEDARYLRFYRWRPSKWAEHHVKIDLARYRSEDDLVAFLKDSANEHTWAKARLSNGQLTLDPSRSYQAEALDLLGKPLREGRKAFVHRVALKWANGIAKTTTAALAVLWFMDCFPGGRVLSTAGTWSQLREQLWREINTWRNRAIRPTAWSAVPEHKTQIDIAPDWSAIGRAAKDEASFEGPHARDMLVVVDEAKAVPADVLENAIRLILRGDPEGRFWLLVLSSPGSPSGSFFEICQGSQSRSWNVLSCSAYESERIGLEQIDDDIDAIGEESPLFVAMDLGEFPDEGERTLIHLSHVLAAVDRRVDTFDPATGKLDPAKAAWRTLGIDVAGRGSDETVLLDLIGRRAQIQFRERGYCISRGTFIAGEVNDLAAAWAYDQIVVDDVGVGFGLTNNIVAAGLPVVPIMFGEAAIHSDRFANLKSELYWRVRVELEAGYSAPEDPDAGFSIPNDKTLIADLTGIEYDRDERLRIKVEGHRQMAARNWRSPNTGDGLVLANAARSEVGREEIVELPNVLP